MTVLGANALPVDDAALPRGTVLRSRHLVLAGLGVVVAALVGLAVGPVFVAPHRIVLELLDRLPGISVRSGLSVSERAIVWDIRTPRVVLGLLVGALLSGAGAAYQGVFRNPLADPYLLGIGAGAGLGATIAIVADLGDGAGVFDPLPIAAFMGALLAVGATALLSTERGRPSAPASLILGGIAITSLLTAVQTYLQQRNTDDLRRVYSWVLGRLSTSGWNEVVMILPYATVCLAVLVVAAGAIDVLAVGDEEAISLGQQPSRIRWIVLIAASLATAAAVAVSGLIVFVGLVVPHAVRMVVGTSQRAVLPLSILTGAAFLTLADVVARTIDAPAELPIGVITAFLGAPFFLYLLRGSAS